MSNGSEYISTYEKVVAFRKGEEEGTGGFTITSNEKDRTYASKRGENIDPISPKNDSNQEITKEPGKPV